MAVNLRVPVKAIVTPLVAGNYPEIERITASHRMRAAHISRAISDYGRTLVLPPDSAYDAIDVVEVRDAVPLTWSVRMDLWTAEQGESDLTLELTVIQSDHGFRVELDDIHVL